MKKTYIAPATGIMKTQTVSMLAGSPKLSSTSADSQYGMDSKEDNFWGDDEW